MALSVSWGTKVINVLQADLTPISGTLYELDTDQFRRDLKALEDDVEGMPFPDTHIHNTEVTVAGITYARFIEIINGYSVTFEDGQYTVRLAGSNNNIFDVENGILNQNQVQVIPGNAAGLIVKSIGSGLTTPEHDQLMALDTDYLKDVIDGKKVLVKNGLTWELIIYDPTDGVTPILNKEMKDKDGNDITDLTAGILAQELANSV
ncbi:MAG: hypothetical protein JRI94_00370 [Deltaproteobacteria bacterium]|nr:hypothetical protein [Deltaproteobacteria bacterium]